MAAVLVGVMRRLGCPFDGAWCLVCELCLLTVDWVDCGCFLRLSFVFLGVPGVWSFLRVTHSNVILPRPQKPECAFAFFAGPERLTRNASRSASAYKLVPH